MESEAWTPERLALARIELEAWAGTPHRNRVAIKGQGVDCIRLVCQVLFAAGIVPEPPRFPYYDERLGVLRARNIIEDILVAHLHASSQDTSTPKPGDIIVCNCGRQTNHVGLYLDGQMWHVPGKGMVGPEPWDTWAPRTQSLVRIHATGYKVQPGTLTWERIRSMAGGQ